MTMQLSLSIDGLRNDITALTGLGDEATARAGERIAAALGPVATVRFLELLGQAAVEVSSQLGRGHVELRVAGDEASLVVMAEQEQPPAQEAQEDAADLSARVTLRLPEQLKARIEEAADREGSSTNTWIVRALSRAVAGGPSGDQGPGIQLGGIVIRGLPGHRLRGFGNT
jgi:hypothetical protein